MPVMCLAVLLTTKNVSHNDRSGLSNPDIVTSPVVVVMVSCCAMVVSWTSVVSALTLSCFRDVFSAERISAEIVIINVVIVILIVTMVVIDRLVKWALKVDICGGIRPSPTAGYFSW